jgi:8-oxo-dGTP pyrophosphatase MutT (NUDIX family)
MANPYSFSAPPETPVYAAFRRGYHQHSARMAITTGTGFGVAYVGTLAVSGALIIFFMISIQGRSAFARSRRWTGYIASWLGAHVNRFLRPIRPSSPDGSKRDNRRMGSTDDHSDGAEWWDVVDAEGTPTGATHRRGAPGWPTGRFHLIVAVCVSRGDGTVLLTQRSAAKSEFPFGWEFPGGSALAGESSREAAARELREETGIDVPPSVLVQVGRFTEQSALLDIFVARQPPVAHLTLQESEVMAAEWVTPEEVMRRLDSGLMADPWIARLESLWTPILRALRVG